LLLQHMRAHPDLDFSPYELAKVLHRSHGTVRRHLLHLAAAGVVTRTTVRPARFQITT
jgi:predicted transcriptional regulator